MDNKTDTTDDIPTLPKAGDSNDKKVPLTEDFQKSAMEYIADLTEDECDFLGDQLQKRRMDLMRAQDDKVSTDDFDKAKAGDDDE